MMNYRAICLLATVAAWTCLGAAQTSQVHSTAKPSEDSLHAANKPLTPKSAMPQSRKPSSVAPNALAKSRNTNAELTRLEQTNIKAAGSTGTSKKPATGASAPKPAGASNGNGSAINFNYQKPTTSKQN
jgi:hypothetical protein